MTNQVQMSHKHMSKRGTFITLYGINNIGKTTHAKRLVARLKREGKSAVYVKYPVYSQKPTGPFLNSILRRRAAQKMPEEELQLWFVLNRYQFQPKLKKLFEKGTIVVAEDYIATGIAWGIAKGAKLAELEVMNKFLVQPDVAILLDGKRKESAREARHIHEKNETLLQKCQKVYRKLAKRYGWKVVAIDPDKDVTAARIWSLVQKETQAHS